MRKRNGRILSVFLSLMLFISVFNFQVDAASNTKYKSEKLNSKQFLNGYTVSSPITQTQVIDVRFNIEDGVNMMYSSSMGTPAVFNVFDLDNKKMVRTFKLTGCTSVWTHGIDSKGNVYISTQDKSFLFRYSPVTKELENLGSVAGQGATYDMVIDEEDNVYVGSYPSGTVVKYDPKTKQFTSLPAPQADNKYIRSLGYYKGNLYAGTFGNGGKFFKIDAKSGKSDEIPLPKREGYTECENIYAISTVRNYVFLFCNMAASVKVMLIYDAEKGAFIEDYAMAPQGGYATPELNGKAYFSAGGYMHELDLETGKLTKTEKKFGLFSRGGAWLDIKGEEGFVGKTFVTVTYSGNPFFYNIETGKYRNVTECIMSGSGIQLHNLTASKSSNKIFISGYVASSAAEYNVNTNTTTTFALGQAENMYDAGDNMYFGVYPGGHVFKADVTNPDKVAAPKKIFTIGEEQDRPYGADGGDGKVFFGTIPDYGKLGGALTVYDEATNTYEVFRNVVKNQSIIGLAYKDGLVYGSTTIGPGLGVNATEPEARMFIFDVKTKKVVKVFIPNFPDVVPDPIKQIGDLEFGPDGLLWGAVRNYIFALDPVTLEIKKDILLNKIEWVTGEYWRPIFLRFASDGTLYVSENGINIIDIDTMEVMNLREFTGVDGNLLALDKDDNVYINDSSRLIKVTAVKTPLTTSEKETVNKQFEDSIALQPDQSIAVVNKTPKMIDIDNKNVAPTIINGRTLVPVRFISENFNGDVAWDDSSQTVTINIENKKISLVINESKMMVDGKEVSLDVPAQTINSRTMLPLRALCESALGKSVYWNDGGLIYVTGSQEKISTMTDKVAEDTLKYFKDYLLYDYAMEQIRVDKEEKEKIDKELLPYLLKVENADFEDTKPSDSVKKWTPVYSKTMDTIYSVSDKKSYKGTNSLYFEDNSTTIGVAMLSTPFTVKAGAKFKAKVNLFIEEGRTSFGVKFYDTLMNEISMEIIHVTTGIGSWQEIEIDVKVPDGAILARVMPSCSNLYTTKAFYDNLRVYQFEK